MEQRARFPPRDNRATTKGNHTPEHIARTHEGRNSTKRADSQRGEKRAGHTVPVAAVESRRSAAGWNSRAILQTRETRTLRACLRGPQRPPPMRLATRADAIRAKPLSARAGGGSKPYYKPSRREKHAGHRPPQCTPRPAGMGGPESSRSNMELARRQITSWLPQSCPVCRLSVSR
jgi:hypothetical protein